MPWTSCQVEKSDSLWKSRFLVSLKKNPASPCGSSWRSLRKSHSSSGPMFPGSLWPRPPAVPARPAFRSDSATCGHHSSFTVGSACPLEALEFGALVQTTNQCPPWSSRHVGLFQRDFPEHFRNINQFFWAQVDGHSDSDKDLRRYVYPEGMCLSLWLAQDLWMCSFSKVLRRNSDSSF